MHWHKFAYYRRFKTVILPRIHFGGLHTGFSKTRTDITYELYGDVLTFLTFALLVLCCSHCRLYKPF